MEKNKTTRTMLPIYVITHYGASDSDTLPFFMKADRTFTANEHSSYIAKFESFDDALEARDEMNEKLENAGHCLAGKLHIMRLGLVDVEVCENGEKA